MIRAAVLALVVALAACGVKAPPRPPEPERPQTEPAEKPASSPGPRASGT
jgi:predicted small lipoprotein YifL